MGFSATDHAMMARALRLAERGAYTTRPNPMVGCVLVNPDSILCDKTVVASHPSGFEADFQRFHFRCSSVHVSLLLSKLVARGSAQLSASAARTKR